MMRLTREGALAVLGLEKEPYSGIDHVVFHTADWAKAEWLDYQVIEHLLAYGSASNAALAADIGIRGTRAAGRLKALQKRRLVKEVRGAERQYTLDGEDLDGARPGKVWELTQAALDKAREGMVSSR